MGEIIGGVILIVFGFILAKYGKEWLVDSNRRGKGKSWEIPEDIMKLNIWIAKIGGIAMILVGVAAIVKGLIGF